MSLKKIKLYGKLRKFIGQSTFKADVASPAEAFKFLVANFPKVESHLCQHYYRITMGKAVISEDLLHMKGEEDISIIPVVTGSGFVFAAAGALFSGAVAATTAVASAAVAIGGAVGGAIVAGASAIAAIPVVGAIATSMATSLVVDGIVSLLTPTPDIPTFDSSGAEQNAQMQGSNFAFNGIANISRSGVCVPVIYGERFIGSIIVSNGVDTVQVEGTA